MPQGNTDKVARRGWFTRFLDSVEWLGNPLPHPVTLFALLAVGMVLLSGVFGALEVSVLAADWLCAGADSGLGDAL